MIKKNELKNVENIDTILFDIDHTMIFLERDDVIVKEILDMIQIPYIDEYGTLLYDSIVSAASKKVITLETLENEFERQMPFIKKYNLNPTDFRMKVFETELKHVKPIDGIKDVVNTLSAYYQIHCFTDWFYDLAVSKIKKIGLIEKISSIISSQNRFSKKDLESFKIILTELNKLPNQVVMVGDSLTDIHCSQLGIQSILVDYHNSKDGLIINEASAVVTESTDIAKILMKKGETYGTR